MWCSWVAPFLACWAVNPGNVLEVGVGHFSTPAIHSLVTGSGHSVTSLEDNDEWMKMFCYKYRHPSHSFVTGNYDRTVATAPVTMDGIAIALIDNSPGGERRKKDFLTLIDRCDYVLVHDYHRENEEAIAPHLGGINWVVYGDYQPPTLVASKTKAIPAIKVVLF